jgi:hypothetical protein
MYGFEMLPFKVRGTSEYIDEVKPYQQKIEKINKKLKSLPDYGQVSN